MLPNMKRLNLRKRHRGYTLAICMISITIIMMFTSIILFSVTLEVTSLNLETVLTDTKREMSQIGEDFLMGKLEGGQQLVGDYIVDVDGKVLRIMSQGDAESGGRVLMTVEKDDLGNIIRWQKHNAEQAEIPDEGT